MNKKLAIIRNSYRPDGGAEKIISRIILGLKQRDRLDVSIITRQWKPEQSLDNHIISCPKRGWFRQSKFKYFIEDVTTLLKQYNFDWVQSHERIPGCKIYRAGDGVHKEWLEVRKRGASAFKVFLWDYSFYHKAVLKVEKALFSHPELQIVICNSTQIKKDILKHYPETDPNKLVVIYNGIDLDEFSFKTQSDQSSARAKLGLKQDSRILLFVGSGFQRKGLNELLLALAQTDQWQLLVVGKDKNMGHFKKVCHQLNISHRVTFVGLQKQVHNYYAACDLLVHPALYDPAPNVILEAMASGRGVIASEGCGNSDLVSQLDGKNRYVYQRGDITGLAQRLRDCDDITLGLLGKKARQVAEGYSITRMINSLLAVYHSLDK
ncbi:MAG: glycosyltransferase family 4 protein [Thiotrichaceae bacterium]|nr:glycosyltransferase family 4 protein [Thiotrichaceae bacterium]